MRVNKVTALFKTSVQVTKVTVRIVLQLIVLVSLWNNQ